MSKFLFVDQSLKEYQTHLELVETICQNKSFIYFDFDIPDGLLYKTGDCYLVLTPN